MKTLEEIFLQHGIGTSPTAMGEAIDRVLRQRGMHPLPRGSRHLDDHTLSVVVLRDMLAQAYACGVESLLYGRQGETRVMPRPSGRGHD